VASGPSDVPGAIHRTACTGGPPRKVLKDTRMAFMTSDQIRKAFIDFYTERHGHRFVPSSPCVPLDDPTLLFTNAGMNQFKPLFLNTVAPDSPLAGLKRAVNSQKCIRAGGKHNDLEDVGKDTYHHTFFEMLGTWGFGDYFKRESIAWGFELLTKVYGIPADRLYATYFAGNPQLGLPPDEESRELWRQYLPESHVIPGGMKDNFWEMGDTGPCGPCSEIHYDRIGDRDASLLVNRGDPDVIEIWNHVFIQFNREDATTLRPLPARHVDTGMGLERLVSVLQRVRSNYDTDLFAPLFLAIERVTRAPRPYSGRLGEADVGHIDTAYRVIADHARTLTFAITDGAVPGNEGRGYVLRRILRRAVRYGTQVLEARTGFFSELVPVVVERLGGFYPELRRDPARVAAIIRDEEESFGRTLARGIVHFDEACVRALTAARLCPHHQIAGHTLTSSRDEGGWTLAIHRRDGHVAEAVIKLRELTPSWVDAHFGPTRTISGEDAFKLYDTYGFPVDLTQLMAQERGLQVDMAGFTALMEQAREKARAGARFGAAESDLNLSPDAVARLRHMAIPPTDEAGKYEGRDLRARVLAIWNGSNFDLHTTASQGLARVAVILDRTSMYAEMGGQVADTGRLSVTREAKDSPRHGEESVGPGEFRVEHVQVSAGYVLHIGRATRRELRVGDEVLVCVDAKRRAQIASNHTATHLVNLALRTVLGPGTDQKGSLVAPDRLRFDFAAPRASTPDELARVQALVDAEIAADRPVHAQILPLDKARTIKGVRAVFGEAYPDPVRVVSIGPTPTELLSLTDEAAAMSVSAEFCGGTHVSRTGEIGRFALLGEEAVAKGIRRVTAVTGVAATAAYTAADGLAARIDAAERLELPALADEVRELTSELDQLTLPCVIRARLRERLQALQEKVRTAGKAAAAARAEAVVRQARALAESPEFDGSCIVATIDAGTDREALAAAMNTIRARRSRSGVLLISPDQTEDKLTILATVPPDLIKRGLNAGEWVKVTAAACGGRGGGRPDQAQGGGTGVARLREVLLAAKSYAFSKCPT
jgi:alanyl-tRNA synthetase